MHRVRTVRVWFGVGSLALVAAVALVVVLLAAPQETTEDKASGSGQLARARDGAGASGILYVERTVYRRYGDQADSILGSGDIGALPERYVQETWARVNSAGVVVEAVAAIRAADTGELVQRTRAEANGFLLVENLLNGARFESTWTRDGSNSLFDLRGAGLVDTEDRIARGEVRVEASEIPGRRVLVTERNVSPGDPGLPTLYADLAPMRIETREEVDEDSFPFLTTQWVTTSGGDQVLVESTGLRSTSIDSNEWDSIRAVIWPESEGSA